jgi:hypothetical protein
MPVFRALRLSHGGRPAVMPTLLRGRRRFLLLTIFDNDELGSR